MVILCMVRPLGRRPARPTARVRPGEPAAPLDRRSHEARDGQTTFAACGQTSGPRDARPEALRVGPRAGRALVVGLAEPRALNGQRLRGETSTAPVQVRLYECVQPGTRFLRGA